MSGVWEVMRPRVGLSFLLVVGTAGCDVEPNAQLNDATTYRQPIIVKDKVARREGTLVIAPTPFGRGAKVIATAHFDQPEPATDTGNCGGSGGLRDYRLKFIALDDSGSPVPTIATVVSAPFANAAKGARVDLSFASAFVPTRASPGLRAVASFHQDYCAAPSNTVESTEVTVAQAEFSYTCGTDVGDPCRYEPLAKP